MTDDFALLETAGKSPASLWKSDRFANLTWKCPECLRPKPGTTEVDVRIQELELDDPPLTYVSGAGLTLCRDDLLRALGPEVSTCLFLGKVLDRNGQFVDGWRSVHGRHRVVVRGSAGSQYRRCGTCGRNLYRPQGTRYLFPRPEDNVAIFCVGVGRLVIPYRALEEIDTSRWPALQVERLKVLEHDKDGLGELPGDL